MSGFRGEAGLIMSGDRREPAAVLEGRCGGRTAPPPARWLPLAGVSAIAHVRLLRPAWCASSTLGRDGRSPEPLVPGRVCRGDQAIAQLLPFNVNEVGAPAL